MFSPPLLDRLKAGDALDRLRPLADAEFLGGPGRAPEDIVIDPVFAGSLETTLADAATDSCLPPATFQERLRDSTTCPLLVRVEKVSYKHVLTPDGLALGVAAATDGPAPVIVGGYLGCSLAVAPEVQRQGIGTRLVMLRYLSDHALPLWDHDTPGYSPDGHAVHLHALTALRALTGA